VIAINTIRSKARSFFGSLTRRALTPFRANAGLGYQSQIRVRLGGRILHPVIRRGSSDIDLVNLILCENSEYRLPDMVKPRVIFDIGANIGITALYYSVVYPEAQIYCFEPLPENLELLRINAQRHSDRIHVIPKGLSDTPGWFEYSMSPDPRNFGGGGFSYLHNDRSRRRFLPLTTVRDAMRELKIRSVDVFKIDTEGSERAILRGIPESVKTRAQAFIGKLHGIGNWYVCEQLAKSHAVGVHKRFDAGCFPFIAVRQDLVHRASVVKRAA